MHALLHKKTTRDKKNEKKAKKKRTASQPSPSSLGKENISNSVSSEREDFFLRFMFFLRIILLCRLVGS